MKTAKVCLDRVWTNNVKTYWYEQPSVGTEKHNQMHDLKYGLRSKVKSEPITVPEINIVNQKDVTSVAETENMTEDLIKHAESLLKHARQTTAQQPRKQKLDVGTGTNTQEDHDQASTSIPDNENAIATNEEANSMDTPPAPTHKIKCKLCRKKFFNIEELQTHHKLDHGVAKCKVCSKCFDTKSALDKHMTCHNTDVIWLCDSCGKGFDYKSCLLQHKRVHDNETKLYCNNTTCDKSFKNV